MKKIEAIFRSSRLYAVKTALAGIGVGGMTVYEVKGMGTQKGQVTSGGRPGTFTSSYLNQKTKIEVICDDTQAERVISVISTAARTGKVGDGKIFLYNVEDSVRIRTGERGDQAV
jgi:nitrogen regulatory protein P-II 1